MPSSNIKAVKAWAILRVNTNTIDRNIFGGGMAKKIREIFKRTGQKNKVIPVLISPLPTKKKK